MRSFTFRRARSAVCAAVLALTLPAALAWTDRPVRMLVPAPTGGASDAVARMVADQLSADIGQPVVVDNKPGAGGALAVQAMLAGSADGQTILLAPNSLMTEAPHVMKTSFDPLKDVKPVAAVARICLLLVGNPQLPARDLKGLIAHIRANPGKMSFASFSIGTASHYAGMILNQKAGLDVQHVPFPGAPPALAQVMGGQIPLMFDGIVTSGPLISSGKLIAYGVASKTRLPRLPQVPTLAEQGYPELDFCNWLGVIVPAKLPVELSDKIHAALVKAATSPKVRERLALAGFEPSEDLSTAQLAQSVRADFDRNAGIVKTFNIKPNQ